MPPAPKALLSVRVGLEVLVEVCRSAWTWSWPLASLSGPSHDLSHGLNLERGERNQGHVELTTKLRRQSHDVAPTEPVLLSSGQILSYSAVLVKIEPIRPLIGTIPAENPRMYLGWFPTNTGKLSRDCC